MYKKVDTSLDFVEREKEIVAFWKENHIFERSVEKNEGGEEFSFFDGPPTANGKPHIGHVLTRSIKDAIPRYRTMKGYHVLRKAGWDTLSGWTERSRSRRTASSPSTRSARSRCGSTRANGKR